MCDERNEHQNHGRFFTRKNRIYTGLLCALQLICGVA
jgi:hypothetical protein